ncbi:MAG: hypothetical protein ACREKJ_03910, partial [Candidatus Rokuibacteriota bacterium]
MDTPPPRLAASHALWERARRVMPGGVYGHQNGAALSEGHPASSPAPSARASGTWTATSTWTGCARTTGSFFFASGAFAAALATLAVLEQTDAIARIQRIGALLVEGLGEQARRHGVPLLP